MSSQRLKGTTARRFGLAARLLAILLGVPLLAAGAWVITLHGWVGVLEGLPAIGLGSCALYLAALGREPGWWRDS